MPPPQPPFGAPPRQPPFGAAPPPIPPFGAAPQPFPPGSEIRPGTGWYWIAVGVGVVAGLVGVVLIVTSVIGFIDKVDDFQRVDVPGAETVHLDEGSYTVYAEGVFVGDSDFWSFNGDVEIRDATERLVELRPYSSRTTYDVSDHEGFALWSFHADRSGDYRVTTTGSPGTIVAIGPGIGAGLFAGIGGGILLIVPAWSSRSSRSSSSP